MKHKMILLVLLLLLGFGHSNAQYGPVVSFTYDDGFSSWYDIGFPLFQEYGFPGVGYINATRSWVSENVDKLLEMQAAGWEISSHTYDHQPVSVSNVSLMKNWLDSLGFPNSGFAAPGHDWSHDKVNIVKKYHTYYSATNLDEGGLSQPFDLYFLRRYGLDNSVSIQTVKDALDDAVANNKWIIFYGHVFGEATPSWEQSEALLRATFDKVVELGIPVKTVSEVITDLFPPGCVIECSVDSMQDPVLTYFEEGGGSFSTSVWNEYWHNTPYTEPRFLGSPAVYCHTSNDSLPAMKFYRNVPNGEYEVRASILPYDPGRTYRLYYSFDSVNTEQYNVEVNKNSDVSLGTVTVTDGQFALYTQKAEAVSGSDGYVGWAFIKLIAKPILLNLKVFLEGPYSGSGSMTTSLNTNNLIPLNSNKAYPTTVYGYYTVSTVTSIPNPDIVDWVIVELRTGTTSETKVATRAAFLKSDGSIVDKDGSSPVTFTGLSDGNYYVVVRHRNHLAIMTASAIPLSSSSALYDFTTGSTQTYGFGSEKNLGGEIYGMFTADGNKDGGIYGEDYILYQTSQGEEGYRIEDYNMDGGVYGEDYILYQFNQGFESSVP